MLVRILTEPKNSIYRQFVEIFGNEGVELKVAARVFEQIAELAIEYKTGARSLRGIFEELLTPILYVVPDDPSIREVQVASLFNEPVFVRRAVRVAETRAKAPRRSARAAPAPARRIPRRLRRRVT